MRSRKSGSRDDGLKMASDQRPRLLQLCDRKSVACARIMVEMGSHLTKMVPVKSHNTLQDQKHEQSFSQTANKNQNCWSGCGLVVIWLQPGCGSGLGLGLGPVAVTRTMFLVPTQRRRQANCLGSTMCSPTDGARGMRRDAPQGLPANVQSLVLFRRSEQTIWTNLQHTPSLHCLGVTASW